MGANRTVSLNGFWANIEDDDSSTCQATALLECAVTSIVDSRQLGPGDNSFFVLAGNTVTSVAERDVSHWGVSLESKWTQTQGVMGVTQAPPRRYFALGADVRGIDQDLDVVLTITRPNFGPITYNEDLDTRYYGAYAAWGGDFPRLLLGNLWDTLGLKSTFQLRGGVYYADTDYEGRQIDNRVVANTTADLSLSDDEVAFIGGLTLETRKRIGRRATLSLKSNYEYYSYVPVMAYNTVDLPSIISTPGRQVGTVIGDDDAFSMRSSLRLTIGLGPRELYREPLK